MSRAIDQTEQALEFTMQGLDIGRRQARASEAQIPSMKDSADAAKSAANTGAASLQLFEFQQRAWIALDAPPRPINNGVEWKLRNFGNSLAFRVVGKGQNVEQVTDIPAIQDEICRGAKNSGVFEVLFPQQTGSPHAAFAVGTKVSHITGCIVYGDPFGSNRWTKLCYEPNARNPDSFVACLGYNSTDADSTNRGGQTR